MSHQEDSEVVDLKVPCPCGTSSDGLCTYTDGHSYCFVCSQYFPPANGSSGTKRERAPVSADLQELIHSGTVRAVKSRGITQATAQHWNYRLRQRKDGGVEHLAVYCDDHGTPVFAKVRNAGTPEDPKKEFSIVGDGKRSLLWGRHLWRDKGRMVVVTEGEIDAMSVSQAFGNSYPVVTVPKGAAGAKKAIAENVDWLNAFEAVVFMFDMDDPGRDAAEECARLIAPGKAKIAVLPGGFKDPNEMLLAGLSKEITNAAWGAKSFRPDGIVDARELTDKCLGEPLWGIPWPWEFMTKWTYGRRHTEVYSIGAGTGVGKSDFVAEVVASTISGKTRDGQVFTPEGFAVFSYEKGDAETKKQIAGKIARRRFHIPNEEGSEFWTQDELAAAMWYMDNDCWDRGGKLFINDHFGQVNWDSVKERVRYIVHAEGVKHVLIDPLTALAAAADDERRELERIMAEAAGLAHELGICLYLISHLATPEGAAHEEGGRVQAKHFKGSRAIMFWSFFMYGLERDTQADTDSEQSKTTVRTLKDRYTGNSLGKTAALHYDPITGTLDPAATFQSDEELPVDPLQLA